MVECGRVPMMGWVWLTGHRVPISGPGTDEHRTSHCKQVEVPLIAILLPLGSLGRL